MDSKLENIVYQISIPFLVLFEKNFNWHSSRMRIIDISDIYLSFIVIIS